MLESHGASRILASFHDISANWVFAGLYFSDKYLKEQPDNVRKVMNGLAKAFLFIKTNEKEARAFLPKYTKVEEELCMISALREYQAVEPPERLKEQTDLMSKYGYIKSEISIESMIDYQFLPDELKTQGQKSSEQSGGMSR